MPRDDRGRESAGGAAEDLLALAVHELRAPLTVIAGYLQILRRGSLSQSARDRAIEESLKAAHRMGSLLDDLAALPDPHGFLCPRALEHVSMSAVSRDVAGWFAHVETHAVTVSPAHADIVRGDVTRLRQAIANLVANAIVHASDSSEITIVVASEGGRVITTVEDGGPGIPPEVRERVFRSSADMPERPGSGPAASGLGLYIVRAIVEAHGGTVRATTGADGRGTRVRIDLPAEPEPSHGAP